MGGGWRVKEKTIQEDPHKVAGNNSLPPTICSNTHTHTSTTYYTGEKKNETKKELKFDQSISKLQDIHKHEICHFLNSIILKMKKKKFVEL